MKDEDMSEHFWERCPQGKEHTAKLDELSRRMDVVEMAVIDIRDKLLRRPSWPVSIMITSLFTLCASLIVYIVTKL